MNEIVKAPTRRKWSLAELDRLSAHGFFGETEHVELIGGELYQMAPKGVRHERIRGIVASRLSRRLTADVELYQELGWRPGGNVYAEPDILICDASAVPPQIAAEHVRLIIEIAKSSLVYDQGLKAATYADLGVAEYWVIDAVSLSTRVHREPGPEGYGNTREEGPEATLAPMLAPELQLRLADFNFGSEGLDEDQT